MSYRGKHKGSYGNQRRGRSAFHGQRGGKIDRSTGISVPGWYGPSPGGGYSGKTKDLDATVQKEAEILGPMFDRDIQIRFNSDRESGGAWLKDRSGSNDQVGLNAALRTKWPNGMRAYDYLKSKGLDIINDRREIEQLEEQFGKKVVVETFTDKSVLNPGVAKKYTDDWNPADRDYLSLDHKSVSDAVSWLKKNVDPHKIKN